ncbi:MAG: hotdog fold thioesterase [Streptosporangiales bacterium]|nr:hotdog fold thioesterase [Streptosporangiales bacterium]
MSDAPFSLEAEEKGFRAILGVQVVSAEPGRATLEVPVDARLLQGAGVVHGGVFTSMVDCVIADALRGLLRDGEVSATIDLNVGFLRPVAGGVLSAEATIIFRGGSIAIGAAEVRDEAGNMCAVGRATFKIGAARTRPPEPQGS